jgi:hypothetical protein
MYIDIITLITLQSLVIYWPEGGHHCYQKVQYTQNWKLCYGLQEILLLYNVVWDTETDLLPQQFLNY